MPAKHVLDHFQLFGFPKLVISIILFGKHTLRSLRRSLLPRLLYAFCILSRWINFRQHDFALCSHKIKTLLYIGHLIKCVVAENLNDHLFISVDAPHGFSQPNFVHCSNVWNVKHIWSKCFQCQLTLQQICLSQSFHLEEQLHHSALWFAFPDAISSFSFSDSF